MSSTALAIPHVKDAHATSIGFKNKLAASAEAPARVGHDITAHPTWRIAVYRHALEPVDSVVDETINE